MSVHTDRAPEEAAAPPPSLSRGENASTGAAATPVLSVNNIEVVYDHVILVLKGVSLQVNRGEIVALLGANGAGKSTTLKAISNLLSAERGEVTKGSIIFDSEEVHARTPNELVRRGCIQVQITSTGTSGGPPGRPRSGVRLCTSHARTRTECSARSRASANAV